MKEESFLAISGYDPSGGAGAIADSQVSSYFGIPFCSLLTWFSAMISEVMLVPISLNKSGE